MDFPAWHGPPRDILGHPAPIAQFVARSEHAVVALQQFIAYPEGCGITLRITARRGSLPETVWGRLYGPHGEMDPDLRFGVRFPDGSRATPVDNAFPGWARPTDRPEPPMLVDVASESGSSADSYGCDRQMWLWPLPPPGPFEFVVEWQSMGIDMTAVTVDGTAIARAAEKAQPYWP
ncbi:hypothetical protein QLQ12_29245 [Actinoplanes sp. NEAU-A12]|uniref:Uncharacterized protein n=1 Tax=Actinoplanes sandaracinus TaxID=3045177 RepID=A0ABT6WSK6_9ACTN|nr:hypothetical protein [Actinoplanes sandaracinus]MDI6102712.1 hypothetical protein [Actinoplanes sandaracinus]